MIYIYIYIYIRLRSNAYTYTYTLPFKQKSFASFVNQIHMHIHLLFFFVVPGYSLYLFQAYTTGTWFLLLSATTLHHVPQLLRSFSIPLPRTSLSQVVLCRVLKFSMTPRHTLAVVNRNYMGGGVFFPCYY